MCCPTIACAKVSSYTGLQRSLPLLLFFVLQDSTELSNAYKEGTVWNPLLGLPPPRTPSLFFSTISTVSPVFGRLRGKIPGKCFRPPGVIMVRTRAHSLMEVIVR